MQTSPPPEEIALFWLLTANTIFSPVGHLLELDLFFHYFLFFRQEIRKRQIFLSELSLDKDVVLSTSFNYMTSSLLYTSSILSPVMLYISLALMRLTCYHRIHELGVRSFLWFHNRSTSRLNTEGFFSHLSFLS